MRIFKKIILLIISLAVFIWILNEYLKVTTKKSILSSTNDIPEIDLIVVPGASVYRSGKLSPILQSRVIMGIVVFNQLDSTPILFSGHSTEEGYNEPQAMMQFALKKKIPKKFILKDGTGSNTYRTLLNCQKKFKANKILIVSQAYHLPRSIYISRSLGMKAYGLASDKKNNFEKEATPSREIVTRVKDFFMMNLFRLFR